MTSPKGPPCRAGPRSPLSRQSWGVQAMTPEVAADQQKIADAFRGLGLIPKPIRISEVLRAGGG